MITAPQDRVNLRIRHVLLGYVQQWFAPLLLVIGLSLAVLVGVYGRPLEIEQDIGAQVGTVSGLYPPEQNEQFTYAYTGGEAALRLPQTGAGHFVMRLRMGGPNGHLPIAARLATPTQQLALGPLADVRLYQVLLPTSRGGDVQVQIQSATQQLNGDTRRLGLLLDWLEVRSLGAFQPPMSLLASTPIMLLLLWLAVDQLTLAYGWKSLVLLLVGAALGIGFAIYRAKLVVQPGRLIGVGCLAFVGMPLCRRTWRGFAAFLRYIISNHAQIRGAALHMFSGRLGAQALLQGGATGIATFTRYIQNDPLVARWSWATFPVLLFLVTRVSLLGFSQVGMTINPHLLYETGSRELLKQYPALDGLCRWDCLWFARIAEQGYVEAKWTNFFPLYPMLVRGLHEATGIELHFALLLIAGAASLGALLVIYRIFIMFEGEHAAKWGLTLFMAYPFAFFQATGYPEALMMFTSALAILFALQGNHIRAGLALGVGVLARHLTLFAGAALLTAQIRQHGPDPKRLLRPALLGLLIPWLCLGGYCLYQYIEFGNPLAFWSARTEWGSLAWWGITDLLTTKESNEHVPIIYAYLPFAILPTIGAIALAKKKQFELAAFVLTLLLLLWFKGIWGIGRYSASCWPAFLPLGVWLSKRPDWQGLVITVLAIFQGLFFFLFSHGFPIL